MAGETGFPMINWAPYFTSGETFANNFGNQFNAAQKLKYQQIKDAVDQEMQQNAQDSLDQYRQATMAHQVRQDELGNQRLDQQNTAAFLRSLIDDARARTAQQNAERLTKTEQDKNYLSNAKEGMDVRAAAQQAYGNQYTPEMAQNLLAGVGMGPTPEQQSLTPEMPAVGDVLGGVAGAGMPQPYEPPPMGQAVLPSVQATIEAKKALEQQRIANTERLKQVAEKAKLDLSIAQRIGFSAAQAKEQLSEAQKKWLDERTKEMHQEGPWKRYIQQGNLNARLAEQDIQRQRLAIAQTGLNIRMRSQALDETKQTRQIMSTELGRNQTEARMLQAETDGLKTSIAKAKSVVDAVNQNGGPQNLQGDAATTYQQASELILNLGNRVSQNTTRLKQLNSQANDYRRLIGLLPDQNAVNSTGKVVPNLSSIPNTPPPNAAQLQANQNSKANQPAKLSVPGKAITPDIARQFLQQSGGDKDKARALARKQGYVF